MAFTGKHSEQKEKSSPRKRKIAILSSMASLVTYPTDPAILKILRVVNLLGVVNLLSHCDLLSWHSLCGHRLPGNSRHFSSQRRVHGVVNMGGVVKTLRRSNSLVLLSS